jgi:hypothetical protein
VSGTPLRFLVTGDECVPPTLCCGSGFYPLVSAGGVTDRDVQALRSAGRRGHGLARDSSELSDAGETACREKNPGHMCTRPLGKSSVQTIL